MQDQTFMTPPLIVDGSRLAFVAPIEPGREAEAFATLLTFATFSEKTDEIIQEAYGSACSGTGATIRMTEERWYQVAKEYFDEFVEKLRTATPDVLMGHYLWLEEHFFEKHRGYESLRAVIARMLIPAGRLH